MNSKVWIIFLLSTESNCCTRNQRLPEFGEVSACVLCLRTYFASKSPRKLFYCDRQSYRLWWVSGTVWDPGRGRVFLLWSPPSNPQISSSLCPPFLAPPPPPLFFLVPLFSLTFSMIQWFISVQEHWFNTSNLYSFPGTKLLGPRRRRNCGLSLKVNLCIMISWRYYVVNPIQK